MRPLILDRGATPVIIASLYTFPSPFQVMLGGKNVEDGFGIAFRVLQVCLESLKTYSESSQHLTTVP